MGWAVFWLLLGFLGYTRALGEKIQHGCLIVWAVNSLVVLAAWWFWDPTSKKFGPLYKIIEKTIEKLLKFILFPNTMAFEFGMWNIFLIRQLRDMCDLGMQKSVSNQAAYYMEWRGPSTSQKSETWMFWVHASRTVTSMALTQCSAKTVQQYSANTCQWSIFGMQGQGKIHPKATDLWFILVQKSKNQQKNW